MVGELYEGGIQGGDGLRSKFVAALMWFLLLMAMGMVLRSAVGCVLMCAYAMLLPPLYTLYKLFASGCINVREVLESDSDHPVTMVFADPRRNMDANAFIERHLVSSFIIIDGLSLLTMYVILAYRGLRVMYP